MALAILLFQPLFHAPTNIQTLVYYYRPQLSCGKVMFLHLSVILFTGGVVWQTPGQKTPPGQTPPPLEDGYASHWNAFLFCQVIKQRWH